VGLYAVQEFDGKNSSTMFNGSGCPNCLTITDPRPGAYGRADVGFSTTSWQGLEAYVQGDAEFGGHVEGLSASLGVRWKW
jgi:hypothetical protein